MGCKSSYHCTLNQINKSSTMEMIGPKVLNGDNLMLAEIPSIQQFN